MFDRRRLTLTRVLAVVAVLVCVAGGALTLVLQPAMVDLEIPLRAAARWAAGGQPYLASAFGPDVHTYDLPFLYPPPLLPLLAPLAGLPRPLVGVPWIAVTLGAAVWLLRRLGVPWPAVPVTLAWVPFSEGLVGGNAQVLLVAAFVAVFFGRPAGAWRPTSRDPASDDGRRAIGDGVAAAILPALKLNQPHGWIALLRRRPRASLAGMVVMAAIALATLPLTGVGAWRAWLDQLARATDPNWALRGSGLVSLFPAPVALALTAASVVAVLALPRNRLASGTGLLLILGVPSLRNYGVLFALPALIEIWPEIALAAVILIGLGWAPLVWAGVLLTSGAWLLGDHALKETPSRVASTSDA